MCEPAVNEDVSFELCTSAEIMKVYVAFEGALFTMAGQICLK